MQLTTTIDLSVAKVLIVDDDSANITLLTRLLQREGFQQISSRADPRRALDMSRDLQPDIVLLDLMMPHIDGFQLLDTLSRLLDPKSILLGRHSSGTSTSCFTFARIQSPTDAGRDGEFG